MSEEITPVQHEHPIKQKTEAKDKDWWKESVVYQIYPRSFKDSNGDGIGDLKGIVEKLDYLKYLGVDVIWLSPIYKSPNDDNGYDISDYYDIMDEFGTLQDWEALIAGIHARDMKLMMDLVVNHTSDEHPWFMQSRASKTSPYRDYYIWKDGDEAQAPNNWRSFFAESAWTYDETTQAYYLRLYSKKMPDLNWDNPQVRHEIYEMMTWWLDKGIDGFRLDTINTIGKDPNFPNAPEGAIKYVRGREFFTNQPQMYDVLKEMHQLTKPYNIMTVGECSSADCDEALRMVGYDQQALNMIHQFEHDELDWGPSGPWEIVDWKLSDLKAVFEKWHKALRGKGWNSFFWGNHDVPRAVSRFGDDTTYRVESAKLLALALMTMEGTPYIYQGDEIGMTNAGFESIQDYEDVDSLNYYKEAMADNMPEADIMQAIHYRSRDNARTPMQWNDDTNAGFTQGAPWMAINANYRAVNVEKDMADPNSILNFYRYLIQLRKAHKTLIYGKFKTYDLAHEQIYCYSRSDDSGVYWILMNFSKEAVDYALPAEFLDADLELLLSNRSEIGETIETNNLILQPYAACIYRVRS